MQAIELKPGKLTLSQIKNLLDNNQKIAIITTAWSDIKASEQLVNDIIQQNKTVYGINTGFGLLANTKIETKDLAELQRKILLSHAAGTGELLPDTIVQLSLLLKINSLARGYSGVRPLIIETLIKFYNAGIYPCIPAKGSVGASGDLAPLAHLCLPLIGEGNVRYQGNIISGQEALKVIDQEPLTLAPKEGLALINGTQISTALAIFHLLKAKQLLNAAINIGALSVDAASGSIKPFDEKIHAIRGQRGQIEVAKMLRNLLNDSAILAAHQNCGKIQDPYCLRCQPQVMGACLDNLQHAENILTIEANAVSDNPLVFANEKEILSGGNFHAEPVAQIADLLAIAISEIGALSERRIALLIDPHFNNGLPAFLVPNPGINSGFMMAHVTAAALASANKSLAHPFSVDSIPTSANQEDHVSMATYAAWRLKDIIDNVQTILAIELLAACQGIELRRPLKSSAMLEKIISLVRQYVAFWQEDRYFSPDIHAAKELIDQELLV
jgi:histidine ammonia-lyase